MYCHLIFKLNMSNLSVPCRAEILCPIIHSCCVVCMSRCAGIHCMPCFLRLPCYTSCISELQTQHAVDFSYVVKFMISKCCKSSCIAVILQECARICSRHHALQLQFKNVPGHAHVIMHCSYSSRMCQNMLTPVLCCMFWTCQLQVPTCRASQPAII